MRLITLEVKEQETLRRLRRECCNWIKEIFQHSESKYHTYEIYEYIKEVIHSGNCKPSTFNKKECELFLQNKIMCTELCDENKTPADIFMYNAGQYYLENKYDYREGNWDDWETCPYDYGDLC